MEVPMRPFSLLLGFAIALIAGTASASGPCPGGRCQVAQAAKTTVRTTVKTTTRAATAPVRVVRRVFGR
jgi:hypothetical protein